MGEIMKWKFINKREIPSRETYWNSLVRSSGALFFQMACEAGAMAATADEKIIDKITIIGYKLGELLQAGDDLKDIKEDMRDGFYSLGVVNYYNSLEKTERDALEKKLKIGLSERELDSLYGKIMQSDSMEQTLKELKDKGDEIIELLNKFPDSEEKKKIVNMINYLRTRMKIA